MRLDELCETFSALPLPKSGEQEHPERGAVLAARSLVATAVSSDEFLSDCISKELRRLASEPKARGLNPFLIMPDLGVQFAFGYWPPATSAKAHEHTAWTITSVCRNRLEVVIFDREASYRENALVPKTRLEAAAGQTGFIYEPCIHEPSNTSRDWSLSLHVTSPRDGEGLELRGESLSWLRKPSDRDASGAGHPYDDVIRTRYRQRSVHLLARTLRSMTVAGARQILAQAYPLAASSTQNLIRAAFPEIAAAGAFQQPRVFTRTNKDLVIRHRRDAGSVSLDALSPSGFREELVVDDVANEAIAFLAARENFDVIELPGLSQGERAAIAEAVEEAGLFRRVLQ